ncbi:MAG: pantoate--beta-alanine ligase [Crocinitomicaceae bacterium]|nr:pantoate--beta-alanine ligase [Crocinitomicaceae bacterium]
MKTIYTLANLKIELDALLEKNKKIGLVPTMGALHNGHASLVSKAKTENDVVLTTIFVNPTQFNNPEDLNKYPRKEEEDKKLLEEIGCDILFMPNTEEIYQDYEFPGIELGKLDTIMEGKQRPGHFLGVCQIVYRLFQITKPTNSYFGLKDFQQVAVIRYMSKFFNLPIKIVACDTVREENGLAMSSRNLRLNDTEKEDAIILFKTLKFIQNNYKNYTPNQLKLDAIHFFNQGNLSLEYLEIVNPETLEQLNETWVEGSIACIVASAGDIRLIDNMKIN